MSKIKVLLVIFISIVLSSCVGMGTRARTNNTIGRIVDIGFLGAGIGALAGVATKSNIGRAAAVGGLVGAGVGAVIGNKERDVHYGPRYYPPGAGVGGYGYGYSFNYGVNCERPRTRVEQLRCQNQYYQQYQQFGQVKQIKPDKPRTNCSRITVYSRYYGEVTENEVTTVCVGQKTEERF